MSQETKSVETTMGVWNGKAAAEAYRAKVSRRPGVVKAKIVLEGNYYRVLVTHQPGADLDG